VEEMFATLVSRLAAAVPGMGKQLAVDATAVHAYATLGQYELAIRDFTTALKWAPGASNILLDRGLALERHGDLVPCQS
jgi:Flp pilus assembly protein TadD